MKGEERREKILSLLKSGKGPIKGSELSSRFEVTRQVIVQDVALLRAEGKDIIATPQGYILLVGNSLGVKRVIAVKHGEEDVAEELRAIVSMGGRVLDVTIEHKIYGEITGKLMLKSLFDVEEFEKKIRENDAKPLSNLTGGVHLHTIEADSEDIISKILIQLKNRGYLIS